MTKETKLGCLLFCASILTVGCSSPPGPESSTPSAQADETPAPANTAAPQAEPTTDLPTEPPAAAVPGSKPATVVPDPPPPASDDSAVEPAPVKPAEPAVVDPPDPEPSPVPEPEPEPEPEPAPAAFVVDVGGLVEVEATKAGLTRIGSTKCKLCHKLQFTSWAETAHAQRTPSLDCESCHGAGSEYKTKKVMEDPQQARAAGMVIPGRSFCSQCHTSGWTDELLTRTHAHKAEDS